jgi:hypothetical protein
LDKLINLLVVVVGGRHGWISIVKVNLDLVVPVVDLLGLFRHYLEAHGDI